VAAGPELLVLDEPFASLDTLHRRELQSTIVFLAEQKSLSVVLVTHDLDEAIAMAHQILVLRKTQDDGGAVLRRLGARIRLLPDGSLRMGEDHQFLFAEILSILKEDERRQSSSALG
jgi:ABC-type nitrate/sulfonate/bicarbonate transport system ATPase subunit